MNNNFITDLLHFLAQIVEEINCFCGSIFVFVDHVFVARIGGREIGHHDIGAGEDTGLSSVGWIERTESGGCRDKCVRQSESEE